MPDTKNVTKQVQSVSPYIPSTNSSLLQNTVDTSLNGTLSSLQEITEVDLNTEDFKEIYQSQQQDGFFVSINDKSPVYSIPEDILNQNDIKKLEKDLGVPYSFLSQTIAHQKASRVKADFLPKNRTFLINEESTSSKIDAIDQELGYYSDGNRRYNKKVRDRWDSISRAVPIYSSNRGTTTDIGKDASQTFYSVIITESRKGTRSYEEIGNGGEFYTDSGLRKDEVVSIKILSNVQNFNFGTIQSFEDVEPRGSQTPMRFYKGNPGRTLGFTAEFYQQEYPREPLLSIAEKAQYLCRPYRHGDYSVIPKLVEVQIPGRSFRGYLLQASVTYSYDMGDYRTWDRNKIDKALNSNGNWSTGDYTRMMIDTQPTGLVGGEYNSAESMDYGLGKMTIDFNLAIVEEIRLTMYETMAEINSRKNEELRLEQERNNQRLLEITRNNAEQILSAYPDLAYTYTVETLVLVDSKTGVPVGFSVDESTGEPIPRENWPEGSITLEEYLLEQQHNKQLENMKNKNSSLFETPSSVMETMKTKTKGDLIDSILNIQGTGQGYTISELESKSVSELQDIRDGYIKDISNSQSGLVDVVNDFSLGVKRIENGDTILYDENYLDNPLFKNLKALLELTKNNEASVNDLKNFIRAYELSETPSYRDGGIGFSTTRNTVDTFFYSYKNILRFQDTATTYGLVYSNDKPPMIDFMSVPDNILEEKYRDWLGNKFDKSTYRYMELSCILAKDFQEMIVYKDANGREGIGSQEIKKFFVSFYKNLVSHNVDFYNNAVSEAKRAFSPITNYFPYLEGGKIKYKTNTNLGYDHFIYIYKVTGDLTSFYKE